MTQFFRGPTPSSNISNLTASDLYSILDQPFRSGYMSPADRQDLVETMPKRVTIIDNGEDGTFNFTQDPFAEHNSWFQNNLTNNRTTWRAGMYGASPFAVNYDKNLAGIGTDTPGGAWAFGTFLMDNWNFGEVEDMINEVDPNFDYTVNGWQNMLDAEFKDEADLVRLALTQNGWDPTKTGQGAKNKKAYLYAVKRRLRDIAFMQYNESETKRYISQFGFDQRKAESWASSNGSRFALDLFTDYELIADLPVTFGIGKIGTTGLKIGGSVVRTGKGVGGMSARGQKRVGLIDKRLRKMGRIGNLEIPSIREIGLRLRNQAATRTEAAKAIRNAEKGKYVRRQAIVNESGERVGMELTLANGSRHSLDSQTVRFLEQRGLLKDVPTVRATTVRSAVGETTESAGYAQSRTATRVNMDARPVLVGDSNMANTLLRESWILNTTGRTLEWVGDALGFVAFTDNARHAAFAGRRWWRTAGAGATWGGVTGVNFSRAQQADEKLMADLWYGQENHDITFSGGKMVASGAMFGGIGFALGGLLGGFMPGGAYWQQKKEYGWNPWSWRTDRRLRGIPDDAAGDLDSLGAMAHGQDEEAALSAFAQLLDIVAAEERGTFGAVLLDRAYMKMNHAQVLEVFEFVEHIWKNELNEQFIPAEMLEEIVVGFLKFKRGNRAAATVDETIAASRAEAARVARNLRENSPHHNKYQKDIPERDIQAANLSERELTAIFEAKARLRLTRKTILEMQETNQPVTPALNRTFDEQLATYNKLIEDVPYLQMDIIPEVRYKDFDYSQLGEAGELLAQAVQLNRDYRTRVSIGAEERVLQDSEKAFLGKLEEISERYTRKDSRTRTEVAREGVEVLFNKLRDPRLGDQEAQVLKDQVLQALVQQMGGRKKAGDKAIDAGWLNTLLNENGIGTFLTTLGTFGSGYRDLAYNSMSIIRMLSEMVDNSHEALASDVANISRTRSVWTASRQAMRDTSVVHGVGNTIEREFGTEAYRAIERYVWDSYDPNSSALTRSQVEQEFPHLSDDGVTRILAYTEEYKTAVRNYFENYEKLGLEVQLLKKSQSGNYLPILFADTMDLDHIAKVAQQSYELKAREYSDNGTIAWKELEANTGWITIREEDGRVVGINSIPEDSPFFIRDLSPAENIAKVEKFLKGADQTKINRFQAEIDKIRQDRGHSVTAKNGVTLDAPTAAASTGVRKQQAVRNFEKSRALYDENVAKQDGQVSAAFYLHRLIRQASDFAEVAGEEAREALRFALGQKLMLEEVHGITIHDPIGEKWVGQSANWNIASMSSADSVDKVVVRVLQPEIRINGVTTHKARVDLDHRITANEMPRMRNLAPLDVELRVGDNVEVRPALEEGVPQPAPSTSTDIPVLKIEEMTTKQVDGKDVAHAKLDNGTEVPLTELSQVERVHPLVRNESARQQIINDRSRSVGRNLPEDDHFALTIDGLTRYLEDVTGRQMTPAEIGFGGIHSGGLRDAFSSSGLHPYELLDALKNNKQFGFLVATAATNNIDISSLVIAEVNRLAQEMRRGYSFQVRDWIKTEAPRPYKGIYTSKEAFTNAVVAIEQRSLMSMTPSQRAEVARLGLGGSEASKTGKPVDLTAPESTWTKAMKTVDQDEIMELHMRSWREESEFRSGLNEREVLEDIYNIKAALIQENVELVAGGSIPRHTRDSISKAIEEKYPGLLLSHENPAFHPVADSESSHLIRLQNAMEKKKQVVENKDAVTQPSTRPEVKEVERVEILNNTPKENTQKTVERAQLKKHNLLELFESGEKGAKGRAREELKRLQTREKFVKDRNAAARKVRAEIKATQERLVELAIEEPVSLTTKQIDDYTKLLDEEEILVRSINEAQDHLLIPERPDRVKAKQDRVDKIRAEMDLITDMPDDMLIPVEIWNKVTERFEEDAVSTIGQFRNTVKFYRDEVAEAVKNKAESKAIRNAINKKANRTAWDKAHKEFEKDAANLGMMEKHLRAREEMLALIENPRQYQTEALSDQAEELAIAEGILRREEARVKVNGKAKTFIAAKERELKKVKEKQTKFYPEEDTLVEYLMRLQLEEQRLEWIRKLANDLHKNRNTTLEVQRELSPLAQHLTTGARLKTGTTPTVTYGPTREVTIRQLLDTPLDAFMRGDIIWTKAEEKALIDALRAESESLAAKWKNPEAASSMGEYMKWAAKDSMAAQDSMVSSVTFRMERMLSKYTPGEVIDQNMVQEVVQDMLLLISDPKPTATTATKLFSATDMDARLGSSDSNIEAVIKEELSASATETVNNVFDYRMVKKTNSKTNKTEWVRERVKRDNKFGEDSTVQPAIFIYQAAKEAARRHRNSVRNNNKFISQDSVDSAGVRPNMIDRYTGDLKDEFSHITDVREPLLQEGSSWGHAFSYLVAQEDAKILRTAIDERFVHLADDLEEHVVKARKRQLALIDLLLEADYTDAAVYYQHLRPDGTRIKDPRTGRFYNPSINTEAVARSFREKGIQTTSSELKRDLQDVAKFMKDYFASVHRNKQSKIGDEEAAVWTQFIKDLTRSQTLVTKDEILGLQGTPQRILDAEARASTLRRSLAQPTLGKKKRAAYREELKNLNSLVDKHVTDTSLALQNKDPFVELYSKGMKGDDMYSLQILNRDGADVSMRTADRKMGENYEDLMRQLTYSTKAEQNQDKLLSLRNISLEHMQTYGQFLDHVVEHGQDVMQYLKYELKRFETELRNTAPPSLLPDGTRIKDPQTWTGDLTDEYLVKRGYAKFSELQKMSNVKREALRLESVSLAKQVRLLNKISVLKFKIDKLYKNPYLATNAVEEMGPLAFVKSLDSKKTKARPLPYLMEDNERAIVSHLNNFLGTDRVRKSDLPAELNADGLKILKQEGLIESYKGGWRLTDKGRLEAQANEREVVQVFSPTRYDSKVPLKVGEASRVEPNGLTVDQNRQIAQLKINLRKHQDTATSLQGQIEKAERATEKWFKNFSKKQAEGVKVVSVAKERIKQDFALVKQQRDQKIADLKTKLQEEWDQIAKYNNTISNLELAAIKPQDREAVELMHKLVGIERELVAIRRGNLAEANPKLHDDVQRALKGEGLEDVLTAAELASGSFIPPRFNGRNRVVKRAYMSLLEREAYLLLQQTKLRKQIQKLTKVRKYPRKTQFETNTNSELFAPRQRKPISKPEETSTSAVPLSGYFDGIDPANININYRGANDELGAAEKVMRSYTGDTTNYTTEAATRYGTNLTALRDVFNNWAQHMNGENVSRRTDPHSAYRNTEGEAHLGDNERVFTTEQVASNREFRELFETDPRKLATHYARTMGAQIRAQQVLNDWLARLGVKTSDSKLLLKNMRWSDIFELLRNEVGNLNNLSRQTGDEVLSADQVAALKGAVDLAEQAYMDMIGRPMYNADPTGVIERTARVANNLAQSMFGPGISTAVALVEIPMATLARTGDLGGLAKGISVLVSDFKNMNSLEKTELAGTAFVMENYMHSGMHRYDQLTALDMEYKISARIKRSFGHMLKGSSSETVGGRIADNVDNFLEGISKFGSEVTMLRQVIYMGKNIAVGKAKRDIVVNMEKLFAFSKALDQQELKRLGNPTNASEYSRKTATAHNRYIRKLAKEHGLNPNLAFRWVRSGLAGSEDGKNLNSIIGQLISWGKETGTAFNLQRILEKVQDPATAIPFGRIGRELYDDTFDRLALFVEMQAHDLSPEPRGIGKFHLFNSPIGRNLSFYLSYPISFFLTYMKKNPSEMGTAAALAALVGITGLEMFHQQVRALMRGEDPQEMADKWANNSWAMLFREGSHTPFLGYSNTLLRNLVTVPVANNFIGDTTYPATFMQTAGTSAIEKGFRGFQEVFSKGNILTRGANANSRPPKLIDRAMSGLTGKPLYDGDARKTQASHLTRFFYDTVLPTRAFWWAGTESLFYRDFQPTTLDTFSIANNAYGPLMAFEGQNKLGLVNRLNQIYGMMPTPEGMGELPEVRAVRESIKNFVPPSRQQIEQNEQTISKPYRGAAGVSSLLNDLRRQAPDDLLDMDKSIPLPQDMGG